MENTTIHIKGMHCRSCEILIEDELLKIPGVQKADIDYKKGEALIYCENEIDEAKITEVVTHAGYEIGHDGAKPWFSRNSKDYVNVFIYTIIILILYYIGNDIGLFN